MIRTVLIKLPEGYPDEALYSIIARWQMQTGSDLRLTLERLFEQVPRTPTLGLPIGIKNLAHHTCMSVDKIVQQHTLYPYYRGFDPSLDIDYISKAKLAPQTRLERELRLACCPLCIVEDFKTFGEPYWHRVHMLPGVIVCPHHNVMLISHCPVCGQALAEPHAGYQYTPTSCSNGHSLLHATQNRSSPHHLTVARDSLFVLASGWNGVYAGDLKSIYITVLAEQLGAAFEGSSVMRRSRYNVFNFLKNEFYLEFRNRLIHRYGQQYLDMLPLKEKHPQMIGIRFGRFSTPLSKLGRHLPTIRT